jgi:hypothetical protein
MCRKVDPTRINAGGTIARFPVITAAERVEAVSTMRNLSASMSLSELFVVEFQDYLS